MKATHLAAWILTGTLTAAGLAGCSKEESSAPTDFSAGTTLPGDFTGSGPGTLVSAEDLPLIDRRIASVSSIKARVQYASTNGVDGSATTVSGTIFSPVGTPPAGGWPVIAWGHGTTGIQPACGPSLDPSLLNSAEVIPGLIKAGYVVTVPDYQGLGTTSTYHPYLDATTEGYNMIDSVRAARKLIPDASANWVAYGGSQGGQAAWASNELSGTYGQGLTIKGSVSLSPASDLTDLAARATAGTLTEDQKALLQWVLYSLKEEYPDLNLDDYRRGIVQDKWDVLSSCTGAVLEERGDVIKQITADDLRPSTPAAEATLRGYLEKMSLPKTTAAAPMLVIYGGQDTIADPAWTTTATTAACLQGSVVQSIFQPDKGHATVDATSAYPYLVDRFEGKTPANSCVPEGIVAETQPAPTPAATPTTEAVQ